MAKSSNRQVPVGRIFSRLQKLRLPEGDVVLIAVTWTLLKSVASKENTAAIDGSRNVSLAPVNPVIRMACRQTGWSIRAKGPEKCPLAQKQQLRRVAETLTLMHDVQIKRIRPTGRSTKGKSSSFARRIHQTP
ncbi:hypothetical protein K0M31_012385 [Melipona bicolor]|uniref:Uncharacterized protein n=1 Tax=Melipona bicolor TaxID=60889 RepID=A0AA40FK47_9HYME|nr:hypothetical protein K0M31_012385 [Melipona bicolor]